MSVTRMPIEEELSFASESPALVQSEKDPRGGTGRSRVRAGSPRDVGERSIVSAADLRLRRHRVGLRITIALALIAFSIIGVAPLLWLAKAAGSTSLDILGHPLDLWPSGVQWHNLTDAWNRLGIGAATLNTVLLATGSMLISLLVATTGGFTLAVLKPKYGRFLQAMVLATLFIPAVVALVPLYLTVQEFGLIGSYWGVWLPAAASAFNVLIVKQFFEQIPVELFDAARLDGAGPLRLFVSIVLPMSKPIIGVVLLLTFVTSWKDFLWPLLALPSADQQPLSVVLYNSATTAPPSLLMAGMFIAVIIPLALFLIFQKQFLRSAGASGALKG